jgi:2-succinyl-5-enolpyruvyl-6-hydroxy-3-cyclohexene-1-carboxylate synthase
MNRGANGIDGMASTAIGAALAWQRAGGGDALAYIGDIATLHDLPGFIVSHSEPRPRITFVISDNDGGGIFSTLEHAKVPGFERVLGTPHGLDLVATLRGVGVDAERVSIDEVIAAASALSSSSAWSEDSSSIRALVVPTMTRADEAAVRAALTAP